MGSGINFCATAGVGHLKSNMRVFVQQQGIEFASTPTAPLAQLQILPVLNQLQLLVLAVRRRSRLGGARLDKEVQLPVHGHDLPAQLQDVSQLGLDDGFGGAAFGHHLHKDGVTQLDLALRLDYGWSSESEGSC